MFFSVSGQRRTSAGRFAAVTAIATGLLLAGSLFLVPGPDSPPARAADGQSPPEDAGSTDPGKSDGSPLERAKVFIDARKPDEAIDLLRSVMSSSAKPEVQAEAYLLMAAALHAKKEYADAVDYLERLLTEFPKSEWTLRARILLATSQAQLGKADTALSVLSEARSQAGDAETKREILKVTGDVHVGRKDYARAIQVWLEEMALESDEHKHKPRERIRRLVQEQMDRAPLTQLRDTYPTAFPGDLVLIRLIELHQARGEDHLAERNLRLLLTHFPNHEYASTAAEQLKGFKAKLKTSQYVIAAVLPTSGRLTAFGTEALNGIRLALDKAKEGVAVGTVGLVVKDSQGLDRAGLQSELNELVSEYHPLAVIGPLISRHLAVAASVGEETDTPFITPAATVADVRRLGTYLFTTALTYPQQARRLADYAVTRMGYKRLCIVHPETAYGQELARLFAQEVRQRGGEIIAVESHPDNATDFGQQIKRLKEEDLNRFGTTTVTETSKGTQRLTYTPGFDAVFLPGSYAQIALLAPQLRFHDIKTPLLGSNAWNAPDLFRLADRSIDGSVFADGLFLDSPDPAVREFVDRYRRKFQANPTVFAAQAYDAARVVLDSIKKGASSGKAVREHLLKDQDLPSLGGPAAFGPGGALERRIFLIQVKQGKLVQLD